MINFGRQLRRLREAKDMKQLTASKLFRKQFPMARAGQSTWSKWESMEGGPDGKYIVMLASFFGVSPCYFFEEAK